MWSRAAAALLILAGGAVAEAGPARRGQVVRIERPRVAKGSDVHLCYSFGGNRGDYLICIGERPPAVGSAIGVISIVPQTGGSIADVARVVRTEPAREDTCGSRRLHAVYYSLERGAVAGSGTPLLIGLTGVEFPPGMHADMRNSVRPPELDQGEQVLGLDADGEENDLVVSGKDCADTAMVPTARRQQCLRYWKGGGRTWKVIGEDVFIECSNP